MSTKQLNISPDLSLPIEAVTQTFAILAKKGSGKTYTGSVLAEEMLAAGQVMVAVDPTGAWYGLRSSSDGKRPGYPVVVFGGDHGDLPLNPLAGEMIAQAIAAKRFPAVLDLSLLRKGESIRFVTAFMETLYRLNREPLHLFIDEADDLCPQRMQGDEARMVGAVEDVVKRGRKKGIGCTLITQRPADLNKQVLTQCEVLFALNISHPKDIAPINEWVRVHADESQAKQMISDLPSLPKGEGWIWSPSWLNKFQRIKIRTRQTFDSGATPKVGQVRIEPKRLAEIDVNVLGQEMAKLADEAKANDPKELKKRIAELEREKAKASTSKATPTPQPISATDRDRLIRQGEEVARREYLEEKKRLEREIGQLQGKLSKIAAIAAVGVDVGAILQAPLPKDTGKLRQAIATLPQKLPAVVLPSRLVLKPAGPAYGGTYNADSSISGPEQRILDAIAWLESIGNTEPEQTAVAFLAGYTIGGGGFNNPRGALRTKGHVEYRAGDKIALTDSGRSLARMTDSTLTPEELHQKVLERLPGPESKLLKVLIGVYPQDMANEELAEATNYTVNSGGFNNPRGRLRTLGLIEYPTPGRVKAKSVLFLEGE